MSSVRERTVPISMERRQGSMQEISGRIIGMLDEIEKRVENMRETAGLMEQEKESLIEMLGTVQMNKDMLSLNQSEKEDIDATTNRLLNRCRTVDVSVSTPRNSEQERALKLVSNQMDELMNKMREDLGFSKQVCREQSLRFVVNCSVGSIHVSNLAQYQYTVV
ncbi:unnamed protein product [Soboliphyme baturini]|uniref:BAG domain-containing protein n=1 Tax=Soboliphyme baturini TaxID=241478 RepID=A0A183IPT2_9BILA|nr:unnamed protein product [Soboliphyme baturini]